MGRATGDPRVRRLTSYAASATTVARVLLADAYPVAVISSRMQGERVVRTEFRWDLTRGDPTASDLDSARRNVRAVEGYLTDEIGPWGGHLTRRVP